MNLFCVGGFVELIELVCAFWVAYCGLIGLVVSCLLYKLCSCLICHVALCLG